MRVERAAETSRRPRVLIVTNVSWFFVSHRMDLAQRARAAGYDVHVATGVASAADQRAIQAAGLVLHDIPFARRGDVFGDLRCLLLLRALYSHLQPALVHLVTMKPVLLGGLAGRIAGQRAAVLAALTGLGHSFSSRGTWAKLRRAMLTIGLRLAIPRAKHIAALFQNEEDRALMVRAHIVDPANAALIRGSGVDLARFAATAEPAGPVRVVLPARMIRQKGISEFVEAARTLAPKHRNVQFLLAGSPDLGNPMSLSEAELQGLCESAPVRWLGFVSDIPALFASCHIVCLPTYYGEGVPKSLIEAAAAGRPIVTTDIPGCRDIVRHNENGLLVPPHGTVELVEALDRLIGDPALRLRFGTLGRSLAEREFGLDAVVEATLDLYQRLIAQRPSIAGQ